MMIDIFGNKPSSIKCKMFNLFFRFQSKFFPYKGKNIFDYEWDNLIILDACRYDRLKKIVGNKYSVKKMLSVASHTSDWLRKTFVKNYYPDIVYVSANPQTEVHAKGKFFRVDNVWDYGWDEKNDTVMPETVTKAAILMKSKYPDKKLIVHYLQPHVPYIGKTRIKVRPPKEKFDPNPFYEYVRYRSVREKIKKAYDDNIREVWKHVERLIKHLPGKTIITSDHGELLGEWGLYFHPYGLRFRKLLEVPWIEVVNNRYTCKRKGTKKSSQNMLTAAEMNKINKLVESGCI